MDDEDNDYEAERQKTIAENRLLLDSLGLDPSGASKIPGRKPPAIAKPKPSQAKKRKAPAVTDEGPRRRSGRLAGIEATAEEVAKRDEQEEKEREVLRVMNKKIRDQVMSLSSMAEESPPSTAEEMEAYLKDIGARLNPRWYASPDAPGKECYAEKDALPVEVQRLKGAFKGMSLRANAKVTSERVFSMVVHPEPTKTLVLVGDKYGQLGIWDALGRSDTQVKDEDDAVSKADEEAEEGRIWQVQAHARNSISCMKVNPVDGRSLYSSSYDCSLRHLDFTTLQSTEVYAFNDEDTLITHFDLTPSGQDAWIADRNGGISHVDFRDKGERRRWEIMGEGRASKLGGLSVNPLMPHLVLTAGNDQHLRIWDVRHFSNIKPLAAEILHPPKDVKLENGDGGSKADRKETGPMSSVSAERTDAYLRSAKGRGLGRATYQHGKSCSAAYWDPWGRRILTTSYDDKLRVWSLNPQTFLLDAPVSGAHFQPSKSIPHNCQTGRWLTILRAQWSLNPDYIPHFTVGNMRRSLDVVSMTGDKIVSLWAEGVTAVPAVTNSHPSRVDCVVGGNTSGRIQLWMGGSE